MSTEPPKQFFFVLALPRSRTAWLSVLLTGRDSFCFHEERGNHADWESYVAALRARPERLVGDSSPALAWYIDELLAEFPGARFLVVRRDPVEALDAFCAARPEQEEGLRASWGEYLKQFEAAVAKLPAHLTVEFNDLGSAVLGDSIHQYLLHSPLDAERGRQLRQLKITTTFPPVKTRLNAAPVAVPRSPKVRVKVEGFDFAGLRVRSYTDGDQEMVAAWWEEHRDDAMERIPLPPLGIIVEDECGPAAALWCLETYGTGVAWIELPVTRPGLSYERASTVMAFAVLAITELAGTGHVPRGEFTRFRVCCPPAMSRLLKRLGFAESPQRSNLILTS